MENGPSPAVALELERELARLARGLCREVLKAAYNAVEPEKAEEAPHYVELEGASFRRLNAPTANRHVATLFGQITLFRRGYRAVERGSGEATIFPLELMLGLVEGATPALAFEAARALAEAGATQQTVLAYLRREHGVNLGVKRLRALSEQVSVAMTPLRQEHQVRRVLGWLRQAFAQPGRGKPVLALSRDGITLRTRPTRCHEVATTGTLSVHGRDGKRLGTVYLAYVPELGQDTMTAELTALLQEVFRELKGPQPRLAYVTDAGDAEIKYFHQVLRKMRHPLTNKRLAWQRIVDFYHASTRLHTMAGVLFSDFYEGFAWAKRMAKLLKKPNGVFRVLHAAAAIKSRRRLSKRNEKTFRTAYNYLRDRSRYMQYAKYKKQGMPIGSGVVEAACKTIYTQRLKLSGMIWCKPGAQTILNLRVILLSGLWDDIYREMINCLILPKVRTPATSSTSANNKTRQLCA